MERVFRIMERVLAICAGTALFVMMILTFVDVVGRYGFNKSIFGASEMIEVLMVVVIFAGVAFVTASDQHIKVDIFASLAEKFAPNFQRWAVHLFSLTIYAGLTYELGRHMFDSLSSGKRTAVLDLQQWVLPGAAVFFSVIGVLLFGAAILATRGRLDKLTHIAAQDGHGSDL
ncbi:MAG: TRAP transporter small permease [Ahrensia sp.]|nr:TRAP transporter small permease [Ahrensia sp.]